jgi:hypothetical protein
MTSTLSCDGAYSDGRRKRPGPRGAIRSAQAFAYPRPLGAPSASSLENS